MRYSHFKLFVLLLAPSQVFAQGFENVFPGLSGAELIDSVASRYRPDTVLDYAKSRDTLYARILAKGDDSLRCIYSGHTLYLDPTQDPTQYVYQNGGSNGMNTEHAYPQGKGAADGNARSDMHHLYPARIPVNEARAEYPYLDIPDAQTTKWFRGNQTLTSIPTTQIEAYSEFKTGAFEPRELVKGDLARSVFYFYTMYRAQANLADPDFFELQRPTLCQWANQDPADSAELRKTWQIAAYQDGKPNPYVIDCTLATRCWCPGTTPNCLVGTETAPALAGTPLRVWPNPASDVLHFSLDTDGPLTIALLDVLGRELMASSVAAAGASSGFFQLGNFPKGLYLVEVRGKHLYQTQKVVVE